MPPSPRPKHPSSEDAATRRETRNRQIRSAVAAGCSIADTAREAGVSPRLVYFVASSEIRVARDRRDARDRDIRAAVAAGESHADIARRVGLSRSYVAEIGGRSRVPKLDRRVDNLGRAYLKLPDHSRAIGNPTSKWWVLEHVVIAERALGRPLDAKHPVHHVNGDHSDNRPANLVICQDQAYHMLLHQRQRAKDACGNPDWLRCDICQGYAPGAQMWVSKKGSGRHPACGSRAARERRQREERRNG